MYLYSFMWHNDNDTDLPSDFSLVLLVYTDCKNGLSTYTYYNLILGAGTLVHTRKTDQVNSPNEMKNHNWLI